MSVQQIEAFLDRASDDVELQKELRSTVEGDEATACSALAELAVKHGFDFSVKELHETLEQLRQRQREGELSD